MSKNSRRDFIVKSALAAAGTISFLSADWGKAMAEEIQGSEAVTAGDGPFTLPPLPYAFNALEPWIDEQTMEIHYSKHHKAYVDKLNDAIAKAPELKSRKLEELLRNIKELPDGVRKAIRNNGGGHWNHSFFWKIIGPKSTLQEPDGKLKNAMATEWQTFDNFKDAFKKAGLGVFGSGWVWLLTDKDGKLSIETTPNQDNTLMDVVEQRGKPILGVDVWEHAYYLKHQNKRGEYLDAVWNVIDWKRVMELYG